jgi:hypothetical protein
MYGILKYDPRSLSTTFQKWNLIVECDYGWFEQFKFFSQGKIPQQWRSVIDYSRGLGGNKKITEPRLALMGDVVQPAWGCHISLLRGEKPNRNVGQWGRLMGSQIHFDQQDQNVYYNNEYFWIRVQSPEFMKIREYFGLNAPRLPFHLTIARWNEYAPDYLDGKPRILGE